MVTALELIAEAEARGARFSVVGDKLIASPATSIAPDLYDAIGAHKAEIIYEIRKREIVLVAARLLRECRWAVEPPVCGFLIGKPGERCRRCGASWIEHYSEPAAGAAL